MYSYCTSKTFKTDISQLCENCPIPKEIRHYLDVQIIAEAKEMKEVLTELDFHEYLKKEIENATEAMQSTRLIEQQNSDYEKDPNRLTRIARYIRNKERIKALNQFKNERDIPKQLNQKKEAGYNLQIGALWAQGLFRKEKAPIGHNQYYYFFEEKGFDSIRKLSEFTENDILKIKSSINGYLNDTFNNNNTNKNLCQPKNLEKINKHCIKEGITTSDEFKKLVGSIN